MKKFTDKQMESFRKMVKDGILHHLDVFEKIEIIDNIITDEGTYLLSSCDISTNSLIDIADERGELGYLAEQSTFSYGERYKSKCDEVQLDKQLRKILGLRDWAGKNEIINELNLVL